MRPQNNNFERANADAWNCWVESNSCCQSRWQMKGCGERKPTTATISFCCFPLNSTATRYDRELYQSSVGRLTPKLLSCILNHTLERSTTWECLLGTSLQNSSSLMERATRSNTSLTLSKHARMHNQEKTSWLGNSFKAWKRMLSSGTQTWSSKWLLAGNN